MSGILCTTFLAIRRTGIEPAHGGFTIHCLDPLGYIRPYYLVLSTITILAFVLWWVSEILSMTYVVLKGYLYNPIDCVKPAVAAEAGKSYILSLWTEEKGGMAERGLYHERSKKVFFEEDQKDIPFPFLQNYSGKKNIPFYSISLWGKEGSKIGNKKFRLVTLLKMKKNGHASFFPNKVYKLDENVRNMIQPFLSIPHFGNTKTHSYPYESDNTLLSLVLILIIFTLFVGFLGIPFNQDGVNLYILSKWLTPSINLLNKNSNNSIDWYEFCKDAVFSVSIASFEIFIAFFYINLLIHLFKIWT
ncbi:NADH:ubiquinone/plastoquinone oxidoreductase, chloroplast chain 5, C-terminal [Cynara cardunculus var. scolymus]|uniref:NAD(P)H-quinone oxidoreductase subunit 5, chloroplastic n=1 Tax=Cynara cardunculus var. scolymus TaxID=59895 RepID=A0A103XYX3_CYNCS|nr:NADH:ubiquinone/plastoquinone oxidoreductase, chloroplast chain 5, C-terminal [Cynara cardunculus var. scolymus]